MRAYKLLFIEDGGKVECSAINEGFNVAELLAFLEIKKARSDESNDGRDQF